MRTLLAPLDVEAAQYAGTQELPKGEKSLLEQDAHDAGPWQPCLAKGQQRTSSGVNAIVYNLTYLERPMAHTLHGYYACLPPH